MTKKFDWPWTFFLNLGSPERQCGGRGNLGNDQKKKVFFLGGVPLLRVIMHSCACHIMCVSMKSFHSSIDDAEHSLYSR